MLQQTRVEAAREYYLRFMRELPDVYALASCEEDRLMKLWEGLGYYSRARNLQKAARIVAEEYGGKFPEDEKGLRALPGVGGIHGGRRPLHRLRQARARGGRQRAAGHVPPDGRSLPRLRSGL